MPKVDFELDLAGLNSLMKGPGMQSYLKECGEAVASCADGPYDTATYVLSFVAVQNVWPATKEEAIHNYRENTLINAVGAAGLPMKG